MYVSKFGQSCNCKETLHFCKVAFYSSARGYCKLLSYKVLCARPFARLQKNADLKGPKTASEGGESGSGF